MIGDVRFEQLVIRHATPCRDVDWRGRIKRDHLENLAWHLSQLATQNHNEFAAPYIAGVPFVTRLKMLGHDTQSD